MTTVHKLRERFKEQDREFAAMTPEQLVQEQAKWDAVVWPKPGPDEELLMMIEGCHGEYQAPEQAIR